MESLDFARKVLRHVWTEFINLFDAEANVDQLYAKELIDESMMEVILIAKSKKDANRAFLLHLKSNATIESLWKLCKLLRDTAQDHQRHDSLAKSLEDELKQSKVPLPSPEAVQKGLGGRGGDGPSSSQATTNVAVVKSVSDLMPYYMDMTAHLFELAAALGVEKLSRALIDGHGTPQSKCLQILSHWLESTPSPTWALLCQKLRLVSSFNAVVHKIARDHNLPIAGDGTSSADMSQHDVYYPVIDDLKISFSNIAGNVLSIIGSLSSENLETFCCFLSNYLKPSFPPNAALPVIPETVQDLKPFLIRRWDPLHIRLLKAVVEHLVPSNIQDATFKVNVQQVRVKAELNAYEDLLKSKLPKFLSKCRSERVYLQSYPGPQSSVSVKIASNPAEISLSRIVKLKDFFIYNLGLPDTLFTGFSEGSIILYFSILTECVWSLPFCLQLSNLSLLEEWKVLLFTVEGAFTVDITERRVDKLKEGRVVHSLDRRFFQDFLDKDSQRFSPLAEYKTLTKDFQAKLQDMEKDLYFKEEELSVVEGEVKVSRKGKGKAVSTDQEIEEKVSFEEKPVVKTELSSYLDIKTEPSPDVKPEPSSKRFKTEPDYLAYESPLEKKAEAEKGQGTLLQAKDTQIAKLLEEIQRLKQERNNLLHQMSFIAEQPASSISPAKPFKPEQNKVFRSDLVRPGELHSVKMPDLLIPTFRATPVTIGRDVYLAGGVTGKVETEKLVQFYNMDSGDCRTLPPSPQYRSAAVAIDGTLVLIGGYSSSTHKSTNMVSTWMAAEERWTQALPPMKMKKRKPCVLVLNNHLFVFGGIGVDGKILLDSFEVLDLNNKQWTEGRGGLPRPLHSPQLGVFGDCVMLYGGYASARKVARVCYTVPVQVLVDSVTNPLSPPIHWTEGQPYTPYFESALLTTSQDAVLVGGDGRGGNQVTRAIHRFSSSGSWEVIGKLSEPRLEPAVVAVSDRSFLVLGGHGDSEPFNSLPTPTYYSESLSTLLQSVELISY